MRNHHFLIVCFPSQGCINPSLQLANKLTSLNIEVTFATTVTASRRMNITQQIPSPSTLSFATFSDGFDDENHKTSDFNHYFSELKRCGSQSLTDLIASLRDDRHRRRPFTFLIYSLLLNWAADVATSFNIPSALFSTQPATVLALYYYYFHGFEDEITNKLQNDGPSLSIELPGLPLLFKSHEMPSFFSPSSQHASIITPLMREQMEFLSQQKKPTKVLVNTFDALENEALRAIHELEMIAVGPLINTEFRGDLFQVSNGDYYMEWLNSKSNFSVVYISFGSICVLSKEQEEEILYGLLESGYPFLWVIRSKNDEDREEKWKELVEGKGRIVSWCRQIEVLKHPSLGCFVSHCGWNSTLESLSFGLPMVAFPQQIDQPTNAKLVEDVWKMGVRVKANLEGIVEREEIRRCLDLVMNRKDIDGEREVIEKNVEKWKELAWEAINEGGSSILNLVNFVDEIDVDDELMSTI
ncbi:crocetin glucosyltransferase [Cucumis melo var. makuwa]|uniref:Glycosyltransferase n=2 Tax=Cucumis melo TaxID=3656 RepID=A0A5D3CRK2_CUCMM|nr:crocetin glucosyltransferase [Cucumis melo var. makuwa]